MKTGCTKGDACDCSDIRECGNVYPVEHDPEMYRLIGPDGEIIDAVPASWEPDHSTANAAAVYVNLSDDSLVEGDNNEGALAPLPNQPEG